MSVASSVVIHVELDASAALRDLRHLAEGVLELPDHLRELLIQRIDAGVDLLRVDVDRTAAADAGDIRFVAELSDSLREFLPALRAWNA